MKTKLFLIALVLVSSTGASAYDISNVVSGTDNTVHVIQVLANTQAVCDQNQASVVNTLNQVNKIIVNKNACSQGTDANGNPTGAFYGNVSFF